MKINSLKVSVCLLTLALATIAPASAQEDANACAPDVVGQVLNLRSHADALGFVSGESPVGTPADSHYQGIQRYRAADGSNWLFVTFSGGDPAMAGGFAVVSMGSRDASVDRMRSNRLAKGANTADTPPDESDMTVLELLFDGADAGFGTLPHYLNVAAPQVVGNILALPMDTPQDGSLSQGRVHFFDISDPANPVLLDAAIELDHDAGTLAVTRRGDGRYFVQITGPEDGALNYYYLSNTTDLTDPATAFNLYDTWQNEPLWGGWAVGLGGTGTEQSFNFVRQCDDDRLFMIGTRSVESAPSANDDVIDVYELFMEDNEENPDGTIDGTVSIAQLVQGMQVWCSFDGTGDTCDFRAGGGSYVAGDGELLVYGLDYYNDGPAATAGATAKLGEFRNRDIMMNDNATLFPVADAGGPYVVDEGSDVLLDGSGSTPATAKPWVELYGADCVDAGDSVVIYEDGVETTFDRALCRTERGIIVDWADRDADDFDYFADLDGFDDSASAARWWAPFGCDVSLFADSTKDGDVVTCSGDELLLGGASILAEKDNLADDAFGDMTSCVLFNEMEDGACDNLLLSYSWEWTDDPMVGILSNADEAIASFHAIDGPNDAVVPLTVCSGTYCDDDNAEIEILNVPPTIEEIVHPEYINENDVLDLSVTWSDPGVIDTHTVDLTWGDGASESSGVLDVLTYDSSHQYLDDDPSGTSEDTYYIGVTVTDKDGGVDEETAEFVVRNVDPVAVFEGFSFESGMPVTGTALIGIPVVAHATFTDVGTLDTHIAEFNWDDGTTSSEAEFDLFVDSLGGAIGMAEDTHTFYESRVHDVMFTATDDDLGAGAATYALRVRNAAGAVVDVINNLKALLEDPELDPGAAAALWDAVADLEGNSEGHAKNGALDKLMGGQYNAAYTRLERAVGSLTDAEHADHDLDLESQKLILALAAKSLAITMISMAEDGTDHPPFLNKIAQAWQRVAMGDSRLERGDYDGAIDQYQQALRRIQGMILPQPGLNPEQGYDGEDSNAYWKPRKKFKKLRSNGMVHALGQEHR